MSMKLPGRDEIGDIRRELTQMEFVFMDSGAQFDAAAARSHVEAVEQKLEAIKTVIKENEDGHH
jgi:hypothetical protein